MVTMEIIKEDDGIAVVEVDEEFYVVGLSRQNHQVYSVLSSDCHPKCGRWVARMNDAGVRFVANSRTRGAAMAAFRREMKWRNDPTYRL